MIIEAIPTTKTKDKESFYYSVPKDIEASIKIGNVVRISFNKKVISGIVKKIIKNNNEINFNPQKIKPIESIASDITISQSYLDTARFVADYYLCSINEAINLFLPAIIKKPRKANLEIIKTKKDVDSILLTKDQQQAYSSILKKFKSNSSKPILLFGVTGSGKTEVYIKLVDQVISKGKQAIILVPEIFLAPQILDRFREYFGLNIAITHSKLSNSEKYKAYTDFHNGTKSILIGPRSALLVPAKNLGIIIIDEEHDDSYKQDQTPRYQATTLAEVIAKKHQSLLILGSATPKVESYYKTKTGSYDLAVLERRYNKEKLPEATVVDLRDEIKRDNFSPLSIKLQEEIQKSLDDKKQILLFINRRGSATFISCRDCGHVELCRTCSIPMVYHTDDSSSFILCHHCGYKTVAPTICPKCQSLKIKYFGAGIEKIKQTTQDRFKNFRVESVEAKDLTQKNSFKKVFDNLKNYQTDILIGTQIITKGLDIPKVDLVGVVSADTGLHLPHYRASEKSFQTLTQVSGRSGRGQKTGQTIIQTYWPESEVIKAAVKHDYEEFFNREIIERKQYCYPPFCHIVRVISEDLKEENAKKNVVMLAKKLKEIGYDFIGPGPCFYQKLRNRYRYHLLVKIKSLPDKNLKEISQDYPKLTFDVDPLNLL